MDMHERIQDIFRTVFDQPDLELTDQTSADDLPDWDSVAHLNLMLHIEQVFGVQFSSTEFADISSAGDLMRLVAAKTKSTPASAFPPPTTVPGQA